MQGTAISNVVAFLKGDELVRNQDEVIRQNRLALDYFATIGIPVALINMAAQSIIKGAPQLGIQSYWLLIYFGALLLVERAAVPRKCRHATLLIYACEAPAMLVTILLGTVWDPSHQALTYLMFMLALPVFILDRPLRLMGVTLGWNAVFLLLCATVKDPETLRPDLLHTLEFHMLSIAITFVTLRLRLLVLRSLERTRYHLEHDVVTDAQNQRCLAARADAYLNKPLFIAVGDIDHFSLLNDFYGHNTGDLMLLTFASTLKDIFGNSHTYRYGGDEMLCILANGAASEGLSRISTCQERLDDLRPESVYSHVTCSFGYVEGTPRSKQDLSQMIRLADIYSHQTKRQGLGKVIGGAFDAKALREGIVESNIATHARAYEINQLTGLPSVAYFHTRSEELLHHIAVLERRPVVGFLNIARFHAFNDQYGYAQGDELIRVTSSLIQEALPQRHVGYISGGQFAILCYMDEIAAAMDHVQEGLRKRRPAHHIHVKAGFAEYSTDSSVMSLLDKAKLAHDSIRDERSKAFRLYDQGLDEEVRFNQYLISHLDDAIANDWIQVHYQPIVDAQTGKTTSLEALSRWNDPVYGFLPPYKFIGVLERERLIYKLSLHVVSCVLRDFRDLESRGIKPLPVSINLSRNDFLECDMASKICSLVDASRYGRNTIALEITESAFAEDKGMLGGEVDRLRTMGFSVWMDDFGSEYSTLNILEELNFDLIKLDMQFMRHFTGTGKNAVILAHILNMCADLGITTLVEGIETHEQYDLLKELGPNKLQGYLFSKPCPLDELVAKGAFGTSAKNI